MKENLLAHVLNSDGYITTSKLLIKLFGFETAVFISELISKYNYHLNTGDISKNNGWFYHTNDACKVNTGLSYYKQSNIIDMLKKVKIINTKKVGMPAKIWYKINFGALEKQINKELAPVITKTKPSKQQDFISSMISSFIEALPEVNKGDNTTKTLTKVIKKLIQYHSRIYAKDKSNPKAIDPLYFYKTPKRFIEQYIYYLSENESYVKVHMLDIQYKPFNKFIEHEEADIGYALLTGERV